MIEQAHIEKFIGKLMLRQLELEIQLERNITALSQARDELIILKTDLESDGDSPTAD